MRTHSSYTAPALARPSSAIPAPLSCAAPSAARPAQGSPESHHAKSPCRDRRSPRRLPSAPPAVLASPGALHASCLRPLNLSRPGWRYMGAPAPPTPQPRITWLVNTPPLVVHRAAVPVRAAPTRRDPRHLPVPNLAPRGATAPHCDTIQRSRRASSSSIVATAPRACRPSPGAPHVADVATLYACVAQRRCPHAIPRRVDLAHTRLVDARPSHCSSRTTLCTRFSPGEAAPLPCRTLHREAPLRYDTPIVTSAPLFDLCHRTSRVRPFPCARGVHHRAPSRPPRRFDLVLHTARQRAPSVVHRATTPHARGLTRRRPRPYPCRTSHREAPRHLTTLRLTTRECSPPLSSPPPPRVRPFPGTPTPLPLWLPTPAMRIAKRPRVSCDASTSHKHGSPTRAALVVHRAATTRDRCPQQATRAIYLCRTLHREAPLHLATLRHTARDGPPPRRSSPPHPHVRPSLAPSTPPTLRPSTLGAA